MTKIYDWNPMPDTVNVRCSSCSALAIFEFATVVRIAVKTDVSYFQKSDDFEYQLFQDSAGHRWHGAIFYHGLNGRLESIRDLPADYLPENWAHSKYLTRSHNLDIGTQICSSCNQRTKHRLKWPGDAYFSIQYREHQSWAFNRESATELKSFIQSSERKESQYKWQLLLRRIPSVFKSRQARAPVVKQLNRLLGDVAL